MPTINLNKQAVLKQLGKQIPEEKLKEHISYLGTDLEAITDTEIIVEIFPNRPDLLSDQGFARALKAFMGLQKALPHYKTAASAYKVIIEPSVSTVRPFTACAVVKGLKLDETRIKEIIQIQEKLHITFGRNRKKAAIGIYPLEKIAWPITYEARKPTAISFTPLEGAKPLTADQILSRHPTGKEYGHLLAGQPLYPVFADAQQRILSMPPIINSDDIGKVTAATRDVFIECSGFDQDYLQTCLAMITTALADMGGSICQVQLQYGKKKIASPQLGYRKMRLAAAAVQKRLGLSLKQADLKKLLARMGFGYEKGMVLVPPFRADILHEVDLIEDIAIAYGYDKIPAVIPDVYTEGSEDPYEVFLHRVRQIAMGLGLIETKQYNLISRDDQTTRMQTPLQVVELANSFSEEWNSLRAWVLPSILKTLRTNKTHEYPQHIFEIGHVFKKKDPVEEADRIAIVYCGPEADYTLARQALESLFQALGLQVTIAPAEHTSFLPGRVGRASCQGKEVAYIGEIHPAVLSNWELDMPVAAIELNLSDLYPLVMASIQKD